MNHNQEVYLLCMMYGTETEILGVYTDMQQLKQAYDVLMTEDSRCTGISLFGHEIAPELPIIYKVPLNTFIGRKDEWCSEDTFIFYDEIDEYKIDIEK